MTNTQTNSALADELEPCPFCGSCELQTFALGRLRFVQCQSCDVDRTGYTEAEAITAWNTRALRNSENTAPAEQWRGHPIEKHSDGYTYKDNGVRVSNCPDRSCGHCGKPNTEKGYDGCLGTIPHALNACCGHGNPADAYIQFEDGSEARGPLALNYATPADGLAGELHALIEKRQSASVDREEDNGRHGPAIRRVSRANFEIGNWLGENWPVLFARLSQPSPPTQSDELLRRMNRCLRELRNDGLSDRYQTDAARNERIHAVLADYQEHLQRQGESK